MYLERPLSTPVTSSFAVVRSELDTRLKDATKVVPAKMSARHLTVVMNGFADIEGRNINSNLPMAVRDYAQGLIDGIGAAKFDALDTEFPERISRYLSELETPVRELVGLQTSNWINYETKTEHSLKMSVGQTSSHLSESQENVLEHENDKLHNYTGERSLKDKECTLMGCKDFAGHFEALYKIFKRALTTRADFAKKGTQYAATFDKSLTKLKEEDAIFQANLQDELKNVKLLEELKTEHTELHEMTREQLEWCNSFVSLAQSDSDGKINNLNREIERLKELKKQEEDHQALLGTFTRHLVKLHETEKADVHAFNKDWTTAHHQAQKRVDRSTEGVKQSAQFVEKLGTLHSDVKLELQVCNIQHPYHFKMQFCFVAFDMK